MIVKRDLKTKLGQSPGKQTHTGAGGGPGRASRKAGQ